MGCCDRFTRHTTSVGFTTFLTKQTSLSYAPWAHCISGHGPWYTHSNSTHKLMAGHLSRPSCASQWTHTAYILFLCPPLTTCLSFCPLHLPHLIIQPPPAMSHLPPPSTACVAHLTISAWAPQSFCQPRAPSSGFGLSSSLDLAFVRTPAAPRTPHTCPLDGQRQACPATGGQCPHQDPPKPITLPQEKTTNPLPAPHLGLNTLPQVSLLSLLCVGCCLFLTLPFYSPIVVGNTRTTRSHRLPAAPPEYS